MLVIAIMGALGASAMSAGASMLQRQATGQASAHELFRFGLVSKVLRNKLWLGGVGLEVLAFFAQALALYNGPLILIAPLLTTDLIFLFALLHFKSRGDFGKREWSAMLVLLVGLAGLLAVANPDGGHINDSFPSWVILTIIFGLIIISGATISRRGKSRNLRTAAAGITAGVHFSLTVAVTKLVVEQFSSYGAFSLFGSWEIYLLAIVGISSALTVQAMYGAGPLIISQPALEITEVLFGMLIGIYVFGESISHSPLAISLEVVSGLILVAGIILLAGSRSIYDKDT